MQTNAQTINKWYSQASSLQIKGKYQPTIAILERVIKAVPNHFAAWNLLGLSYSKINQETKAYRCLQESLKWCPEFFPAAINLADLMIQNNRIDEANELITHFTKIQPHVAKLHFFRYLLARKKYDKIEAKAALTKYIACLRPEDADNFERELLNWQLVLDLEIDGFLDNLDSEYTNLTELRQNLKKRINNEQSICGFPPTIPESLFYLAYYDINPKELLQDMGAIYRKTFPDLNWTSSHCLNKPPKEKSTVKIGIVSAFLDKFHPVSFSFAPLIKALRNNGLEIIYFRMSLEESNLPNVNYKEQLSNVRCIDLPSSIEEARRIIAKQEVDILWYTDICMAASTYFLAYARLAPIQCISGGHPCTTGVETIDYFFSSTVLENEDCQERYTEKVIRLPTFPAIYEDFLYPNLPCNRAHFSLPADKNLYFCAQTIFKIHPKMDEIFKGILEGDSKAVIMFSYGNTRMADRLKQRLKKSLGQLSQRCQFIEPVHQHQFFFLLKQVDVILDTFPFSGGNTVLQAIAMGIPTVTMESQELRGSVGTGLYRTMGIKECLAQDTHDYINKCLVIAINKDTRAHVQQKILENKHLVFSQNENIIQAYKDLFDSLMQSLKETYATKEMAL